MKGAWIPPCPICGGPAERQMVDYGPVRCRDMDCDGALFTHYRIWQGAARRSAVGGLEVAKGKTCADCAHCADADCYAPVPICTWDGYHAILERNPTNPERDASDCLAFVLRSDADDPS